MRTLAVSCRKQHEVKCNFWLFQLLVGGAQKSQHMGLHLAILTAKQAVHANGLCRITCHHSLAEEDSRSFVCLRWHTCWFCQVVDLLLKEAMRKISERAHLSLTHKHTEMHAKPEHLANLESMADCMCSSLTCALSKDA